VTFLAYAGCAELRQLQPRVLGELREFFSFLCYPNRIAEKRRERSQQRARETTTMAKGNKKIEEVDGVAPEREGTRPDFSVPPPRKKLPKDIQATLDDEEKMWEIMYDGRYV
jgi:hypothetical protein